ncbi:MAG TPA: hypothetical protein VIV27_07950, partial [Halioglobus sp.]
MRGLETTRRFIVQVYSLGKDIFHRFPSDAAGIFLSSAASLACQACALLALYAYLKALENNAAILGYPSRESLPLFAIVAIVTLVLLVGFSLLEYRTNLQILRLCRRYQNMGIAEALALSSQLPHWFAADNDHYISIRHLRQILSVDVSHRSRMVRVLLLAVVPAARMVLSAIVLLYLNPQFSILILFAVGLPVLGLYSVGRNIADTITVLETGSPPAFLKQRELLERNWAEGTP